MFDLRSTLDCEIDASDKSLRQCPPAAMCPADCSISELDFLEDIPPALHGKYDVVHVRLIQGGLPDDPSAALKNLVVMLSMSYDVESVVGLKWIPDAT